VRRTGYGICRRIFKRKLAVKREARIPLIVISPIIVPHAENSSGNTFVFSREKPVPEIYQLRHYSRNGLGISATGKA
jgi:hypothetical protein